MSQNRSITPQEISADMLADMQLLDVRAPIEYREVHATPARNIPLDQLSGEKIAELKPANGQPLYVICKSGKRGQMACEKFQASGCENVVNVEGGTDAWRAAGLPTVVGQKSVSIERQVRMVAGGLIAAFSLLSFVNPLFALGSALMGTGLLIAGLTDSCMMGMLLAKMPWNQVAS